MKSLLLTVIDLRGDYQDIQPGGNAATDLGRLRNQYAQNNTRLLYDKNGNFINSADDPLNGVQNSDKTAIRWDQSEGDDTATAFGSHYGANLIGMNQFTIDNMNDNTPIFGYSLSKNYDQYHILLILRLYLIFMLSISLIKQTHRFKFYLFKFKMWIPN